jgi:glycosyltransferase involved in cell wall biosynthesis
MSEETYLSVILPCRNQADHIGEVLSKYKEPLDKIGKTYELVVVPNACTDNTFNIIRGIAEKDPSIRVVYNPDGGWGKSVLTGLAAARGKVLCYTNSARTDPVHIAILLEQYEKAVPCLAKVRREKRAAPMREFGSWIYNLEGSLLYRIKASDINGTPKIMSRDIYQKLNLSSPGDVLDMEVLAKITHLGLPVVEFPVAGFKRHGGKSSTNFKSAWNMYAGAVQLRGTINLFRQGLK